MLEQQQVSGLSFSDTRVKWSLMLKAESCKSMPTKTEKARMLELEKELEPETKSGPLSILTKKTQ